VELDEQTLNKCTFTPSGNIPKALVVEDSKSTCLLFAKVIAGLGWQTVSAQDGACALQLLASEVYDLVLLDVQLPLLSGNDVVQKFREWETAHRPGCRTAVVMMSGDETAVEVDSAMFEHFIPKPVATTTVTQLCEELGNFRDHKVMVQRVAGIDEKH